jgi:hypothetical protein
MTVGELLGFPLPTMPARGHAVLTPVASAPALVPQTQVYRGFKVLAAQAGTNVVVAMIDGTIGYFENVQSGQDYEGCFSAVLTSGTLATIGAVTTTATSVIALK